MKKIYSDPKKEVRKGRKYMEKKQETFIKVFKAI